MKGFLGVLLLLVIGVVGLGFYLGWFNFSTGGTEQNPSATISVDRDKIRKDEEAAKKKLRDAGQAVKEKIGSKTEKNNDDSSQP